MGEETRKILEMLKEGKVSVEEAEKLMEAVAPGKSSAEESAVSTGERKYLRVQVEPGPDSEEKDRVNIRVPMKLIRAGVKLAAFLPGDAKTQVRDALHDKGVDVDLGKLTAADIEELINNLNDLTVDVEGKEKVRIYTE
jgi:hypothetical protein